uniref:T-cell surface glycoprotein CD3 zeta chain n=1 Tax=Oryzias latipes TaxID=8090 RepID=A0A3P9KBW5_ORYLA
MAFQTRLSGLLLLAFGLPGASAETTMLTDPRLCYILDGFLGLYGLIITGMFIKEKFFRTKVKISDEMEFSDIRPITTHHRDPEQGRQRRKQQDDRIYTGLKGQDRDEYRELPVKERPRRNEQVYQDLNAASRDTYDALQMQALPAR